MLRSRSRCALAHALAAASVVLSAGCTVTVVQPYDEKLLTDTEAMFKKAAAMIDSGVEASPGDDKSRSQIKKPYQDHPGHLSKFEGQYRSLGTDADALILRALGQSQGVSAIGEKLQAKIEQVIEKQIPSQCTDLATELAANTSSLTVKNYIDLKCIVLKWREQHADQDLTDNTQILKKVNWELRKRTIFAAVVAIEQAETSKKP